MSQNTTEADRACCSPLGHALDDERVAEDVRLLSGAANDTRYELLRVLATADDRVCACELPASIGRSQSAVSHALSKLHEAGLVTREKDGRWRYYDVTATAERLLTTLDAIHEHDD